MVQCMEAWFLADKEALEGYFGSGFSRNALPQEPEIEAVAKADIEHGLREATRRTSKRRYGKVRWSRFVGQSEGENKVYSDCVDALDEGTLPAQADDVNGIVEAPAVVV